MKNTPKLFVLAGEPSGDVLGGHLLKGLKARTAFELTGVGGHEMTEQGLNSLYPMSNLSVMGYADVLFSLPLLLFRLGQTVRHIMREQPDVVVLIDSQVFTKLMAQKLRKRGFKGHIILYVAPTVWVWQQHRAAQIKPLFDEVLAVLPFEPKVMAELGGPPTSFVGHPAVERYQDAVWHEQDKGKLALLPGSRSGELSRHLPICRKAAEHIADHANITGFILPTLPQLQDRLEKETANWAVPVEVVSGPGSKRQAFEQSVAALASAGTASLELALAGVPIVGIYVPDKAQMRLYEGAGRPSALLPNIVLGKRYAPEIEPGDNYMSRLFAALDELVDQPLARRKQQDAFKNLRHMMEEGLPETGRQDAADRVLHYLEPGA